MRNRLFIAKYFRRSFTWGQKECYVHVLVFRGIGFRASFLVNNAVGKNGTEAVEFSYSRYLLIRAGHTIELVQPVPRGIFAKIVKKDRKLVIFGKNKGLVKFFASSLCKYRLPSLYTGRGIRQKSIKVLRKVRKDKQKQKKGKKF